MTEITNTAFDNIAGLSDFANNSAGVWQSFTAINTPGFLNLIAVELYGKTPDTGEDAQGVTIIIYDGTGTGGPVVASINSITVPSQIMPNWTRFQFPSPFFVLTPGNVYTIQITGTGAIDFLWGFSIVTPFSTYPGGMASFPPNSDLFFRVQTIDIPTDPNLPTTFPFLQVGNGSAPAPSYSFTNAQTTGLYVAGVDTMGISSGGVERLTFPPSADILPIGGAANGTTNLGGLLNSFGDIYINHMAQPFFLSGTATPTLESTSGAFAITYVQQSLRRIFIGTLVYMEGVIEWSAAAPPGTGNLIILFLPDAPVTNNAIITVAMSNVSYTAGATVCGRTVVALNALEFIESSSGAAEIILSDTLAGGGAFNKKITFTGTYERLFPLGP